MWTYAITWHPMSLSINISPLKPQKVLDSNLVTIIFRVFALRIVSIMSAYIGRSYLIQVGDSGSQEPLVNKIGYDYLWGAWIQNCFVFCSLFPTFVPNYKTIGIKVHFCLACDARHSDLKFGRCNFSWLTNRFKFFESWSAAALRS